MATDQTGRIADRNPNSYTIAMPQVLFSPLPATGNFSTWVDHVALSHTLFGITNDSGYVVNSMGNAVGTPDSIMKDCFIGSLDSASLGGDVETLEHTVANLGAEEVDRIVALQRPYEYDISFDEPDIKNMSRFMLGQETNLGLSLRNITVTGKTFVGSETEVVTVVDRRIGDPAKAMDTIISLWYAQTGGQGNPPNGTYGFVVGGTNEDECVGDWANRRQWIAYADFDFGAKTVGPWAYLRPHGTALGGAMGAVPVIPINGVLLSIPDSEPIINRCGNNISWNADSVVAWTGLGWYGADEGFFGYSIMQTTRAYRQTEGAAIVANLTNIGPSRIHVVPRCTLMPDGTFDFSGDAWTKGNFKLKVMRDARAVFKDRKPELPIPFGYMQTFDLLPTEI